MPNIKSAKKRLLTSEKARVRNKARVSALRTAEKRYREAIAAGEMERAKECLSLVHKRLDKAVKLGTIHKNKSSRKKSRLAALLKKAETEKK
jgi:small subunit ribosomal protein S20